MKEKKKSSEFRVLMWPNEHEDGRFMKIYHKVAKLKAPLVGGRMIRFTREYIKRIEENEKGFLFGLILRAAHFVLHLKNRFNKKLVVILLQLTWN